MSPCIIVCFQVSQYLSQHLIIHNKLVFYVRLLQWITLSLCDVFNHFRYQVLELKVCDDIINCYLDMTTHTRMLPTRPTMPRVMYAMVRGHSTSYSILNSTHCSTVKYRPHTPSSTLDRNKGQIGQFWTETRQY